MPSSPSSRKGPGVVPWAGQRVLAGEGSVQGEAISEPRAEQQLSPPARPLRPKNVLGLAVYSAPARSSTASVKTGNPHLAERCF